MFALYNRLTVGQKLTYSLVAVVALLSAATVATVGVLTHYRVQRDLRTEFQRTAEVAREYIDSRQRRLATGLESLVDSPETKSLLTMKGIDHETLLHSVTELQMVLEADIVLYADKKAQLLARTDDAFGEGGDLSDNALIQQTLTGDRVSGLWDIDGVPHVTCGYPIEVAGNVRGCILAGYAVSEQFGAELKALTLRDVAMLFGGELISSSLGEADAETLRSELGENGPWMESLTVVPVAEESEPTEEAVATDEGESEAAERPGAGEPPSVELAIAGLGAAVAQPHVIDFPVRAADEPLVLLSLIPRGELFGFRDTMHRAMGGLAIISLVGGGLLSFLIVRGVSGRVEQTVRVLEGVASGDYSQRLRFDGKDEFGRIAASANTAIDALVETLDKIREASEREKQLDAERLQAIEDRATRDLQIASERKLQEEANAEREQQIEQERRAQQEEKERQQAALRQAQQDAEAAAQREEEDRARAADERRAAEVVRSRMNHLLSDVEASSRSLEEVHAMSAEIAKIIDIISKLSTEANMLSLNAGIGAAQAGDKASGFAVVAEEMTRLSTRSHDAAAEIASLITDSQAKIEQSTDAARRTATSLEEVSQETLALLKRMSQSGADTVDEVQHVAQEATVGV